MQEGMDEEVGRGGIQEGKEEDRQVGRQEEGRERMKGVGKYSRQERNINRLPHLIALILSVNVIQTM